MWPGWVDVPKPAVATQAAWTHVRCKFETDLQLEAIRSGKEGDAKWVIMAFFVKLAEDMAHWGWTIQGDRGDEELRHE